MTLHAGAIRLELRMRDVRSLKEKRQIVKALVAHLSSTFNVAVSEVGHHELWQRTALGVAAVAPQASHLDRILHSVERAVRERDVVELLGVSIGYVEELP
jgi:hypothetical protein